MDTCARICDICGWGGHHTEWFCVCKSDTFVPAFDSKILLDSKLFLTHIEGMYKELCMMIDVAEEKLHAGEEPVPFYDCLFPLTTLFFLKPEYQRNKRFLPESMLCLFILFLNAGLVT